MAKSPPKVINNYFVCTLGEATELKQDKTPQYSTVNELINQQAKTTADLPAVGFPIPSPEPSTWGLQVYSQLSRLSLQMPTN
jgi:hypothetical protein